jgi:hypothetical protein
VFTREKGHNIPCISRTPILEGKLLSKSAAYTLANTVYFFRCFVVVVVAFMETECVLPLAQKLAIALYFEPIESSPHPVSREPF